MPMTLVGSSSPQQFSCRLMLVEARVSLLSGVVIMLGTALGYSAMVGVAGGGDLGDIAIRYGYYRYQADIMIVTVILLVALVMILQEEQNYKKEQLKENL